MIYILVRLPIFFWKLLLGLEFCPKRHLRKKQAEAIVDEQQITILKAIKENGVWLVWGWTQWRVIMVNPQLTSWFGRMSFFFGKLSI